MKWNVTILVLACVGAIKAAELVKSEQQTKKATEKLFSLLWEGNPTPGKVEKLLAKGADPNGACVEAGIEWNPITTAIFQARFDLVGPLLQAGANPQQCSIPPVGLMASLVHGYEGACEAKGCAEGTRHEEFCFFARARKTYPLVAKLKKGYKGALTHLLLAQADPDGRLEAEGLTAHTMAADRGQLDICQILEKFGAKPERRIEKKRFVVEVEITRVS